MGNEGICSRNFLWVLKLTEPGWWSHFVNGYSDWIFTRSPLWSWGRINSKNEKEDMELDRGRAFIVMSFLNTRSFREKTNVPALSQTEWLKNHCSSLSLTPQWTVKTPDEQDGGDQGVRHVNSASAPLLRPQLCGIINNYSHLGSFPRSLAEGLLPRHNVLKSISYQSKWQSHVTVTNLSH